MSGPTTIELANTDKVLDLLTDIDDISYKNIQDRPDIFEVTGPESSSCILDVEEKIVCIFTEVCDIPEEGEKKGALLELLMQKNFEILHGKFSCNNGKIFFKENLEVENLDGNELEAALVVALASVNGLLPQIAEIL